MFKNKAIRIGGALVFVLLVALIILIGRDDIDKEAIKKNMIFRVETGNQVFNDIEGYEKKYKELAEVEEDPFKKGVYYSSLVQIYAAKNDYNNIKDSSNKAMDEYSKVENGEYYQIIELEYLAWSMLTIEKFTDSFKAANDLLRMVNDAPKGLLREYDIKNAEAIAYSVFLCVYTEFNILDKAEIYYDKLIELDFENNPHVEYSLVKYYFKLKNYDKAYHHALQYNRIYGEMDSIYSINVADTTLLPLGLCEIKLGMYDKGKSDIKKAEMKSKALGDNQSVADAYIGLALYYKEVNNKTKVLDYYKKAIELHMKAKDYYNAKKALNLLIDYSEKNNIKYDDYELYKDYYKISADEGNEDINSIISEMVTVNNELNEASIKLMNRELAIMRLISILGIVVIIILGVVTHKYSKVIEEKKKSEEALEKLVNIDYLTKVSTRSYGEKQIKDKIESTNLSIAILDIDDFKNINDTRGHSTGDSILKSFGELLIREISAENIVYRYGGEEFVIGFIDKNKEEAKEILDNIRLKLKEDIKYKDLDITFSAGIEKVINKSLEETINKADNLLYIAKKEGKDRVIIDKKA